ncbi:FliI/YscN family ATPase [Leptospira sp. GIMC2001]|uniref:FliI/YscN family ATPase n=1 Tax=Leptospira sp. GIMC2001 TaxID=1513297 RepID=UPI0004A5C507|nr:FliI/YscN family ATPase [Leptospira sp. GIMC2001]AID56259.1 flagellum-specific ATP synthase FliL [Leptospira sp. GIMC2001]WCL48259.1 FliI/YscN family ATPase [Leptospira sp. GIMC2001]
MIEKKFTEKIDVMSKYLNVLEKAEPIRKSGFVIQVVGNVIYSNGPPDSRIGEIMEVEKGEKRGFLSCVLVGFKDHNYTLLPLGEVEGIFPNAFVFSSRKRLSIPVSDAILGRVFNGIGKPIDNKAYIEAKEERFTDSHTPNPLDRPPISDILPTGVRAIDGLLTVGKGQRVGIFSGSGVGKSSLLGMIARYTSADVNVIALVGERGREVNEFLEHDLGREALAKSVILVATSDAPKMEQVTCAQLACSVAEYFRDQGKDVLLFMDSLTRYAHALRETSVGEMPITKGFGSSVFSKLSKLVERAGRGKSGGSITGFYTVLTDADEDMDDPIADAVRGYIDGHIVLSRKLAEESHYPAIDIPSSLSRLMMKITNEDHYMHSTLVRELIAKYKSTEELILLNAYIRGTDPKVDMAIERKGLIDNFLKQRIEEKGNMKDAIQGLKDILIQNVAEEEF